MKEIYKIIIKKSITISVLLIVCFYTPEFKFFYLNNYTKFPYYENNTNFTGYSTSIKAIALYIPEVNDSSQNTFYQDFSFKRNLIEEMRNETDIIIEMEKENYFNVKKIENQVELAKIHGIYGFGIYHYYNYYLDKNILNDPLDIIYEIKNIDIHYLLILKHNEDFIINNKIENFINLEYNENNLIDVIDLIYKYFLDERYIKVNNAPIIGIDSPENINNISHIVSLWRNKINYYGIKKIFILGTSNNKNLLCNKNHNYIDGYVYLQKYNNIISYELNNKTIFPYYGLIYDNLFEIPNCTVYKSSILPLEKENNNINIFDDYSPYKFYLLNKIISNFAINYFDKNNQFIFINSFNNFFDKYFLEKDGFASINYLSKAIFNIPLSIQKYDLNNLKKTPLIAIQAHIYFIDLLDEMMDKINNMPVKFDLYITTTSEENKNIIEKYIEKNVKADKYEVLVVKNKGRDVLPFILQMKNIYQHYKYFCHIHSKKNIRIEVGINWRKYLYNNLLGSKELISEILYKFETNEKLGVIFPDNYINLLHFAYDLSERGLYLMNSLLKKVFPFYKFKSITEFPAGNMFWARISAVYQVYELYDYISYYCPEEDGQVNDTILHAVERIWLAFAQLNGYNYTTILKYY